MIKITTLNGQIIPIEEVQKAKIECQISEAKAYLASTDFYYARKLETGDEVPSDVVAKRIELRNFIRANEV